ncbi:LacI family DNA-binding transcriptional regulator [Chelativorans sp.]|uniref:LacI family DNA-binding transcriptional regulator n=1 Tax=Chelativorans sp. TaxID=2203393 RepID=UPI00281152D9|nr:LacI family DNA-binding transcriptional regulator [Chelativorans sp.]
MLDVAEAARVSVATVSAVVNGTVSVSPQLRERIEAAIQAIGYKRNTIARSLKLGKTRTIGLTVADITNPFFTDVVSAIQGVLHEAGYAVMLCSNDEDAAAQLEHVSLLLDRMVDGLIVAPAGDEVKLKPVLQSAGVPIVLIDRVCDGVDLDAVILDNRRAACDAVTYLLDLAHRRIGYVSGPLDTSTGRERLQGYRDALEAAGVPYRQELVRFGNFREADAYQATMELLAFPERPTALFAANNLMVIGVMKAIRDFGLSCPDDISVACFDDFPWADVFQPQLTTVAQPVRAIGENAAKLLLERLGGSEAHFPRHLSLQGRLVIRNSCRPCLVHNVL